jgi:hypothetical protein
MSTFHDPTNWSSQRLDFAINNARSDIASISKTIISIFNDFEEFDVNKLEFIPKIIITSPTLKRSAKLQLLDELEELGMTYGSWDRVSNIFLEHRDLDMIERLVRMGWRPHPNDVHEHNIIRDEELDFLHSLLSIIPYGKNHKCTILGHAIRDRQTKVVTYLWDLLDWKDVLQKSKNNAVIYAALDLEDVALLEKIKPYVDLGKNFNTNVQKCLIFQKWISLRWIIDNRRPDTAPLRTQTRNMLNRSIALRNLDALQCYILILNGYMPSIYDLTKRVIRMEWAEGFAMILNHLRNESDYIQSLRKMTKKPRVSSLWHMHTLLNARFPPE